MTTTKDPVVSKSKGNLVTCIVTRDKNDRWSTIWVPDDFLEDVSADNLDQLISATKPMAEPMCDELQYAIYPWKEGKDIKTVLNVEKHSGSYVAEDPQDENFKTSGNTLEELIRNIKEQAGDTESMMLQWVIRISPGEQLKGRKAPHDLPLLAYLKADPPVNNAQRASSLFAYIFIAAAILLVIFSGDDAAERWKYARLAAGFFAAWGAIHIARNMIAQQTGYVLPWSTHSLYFTDAYMSEQTRKKYGLRKAGIIPSAIFMVAAVGLLFAVLSFLE
jgi:hypothetical protein